MNNRNLINRDDHGVGDATNEITQKIIGCAYEVSNTLGIGYVEKVYENALVHELTQSGLQLIQQHPIQIHYDGVVVGDYCADLIVENWLFRVSSG